MQLVPARDAYGQVIDLLLREGGDFARSPEFTGLVGHGEDLPGVVSAAYARYVARQVGTNPGVSLASLIAPLNELADWNDSRVNTMLRDEVIEQLQADEVLERLRDHLNSSLIRLTEADT